MACEYCTGLKSLYSHDMNLSYKGNFYPGINVEVETDGSLYITAIPDTYEPGFQEVTVPIKYCPMCGEKFEKGEDA